MTAPADAAVADQAVDRCDVIRFLTESVPIELPDGRVLNGRGIESLQESHALPSYAGRLVFEPGLDGSDLAGLCRARRAFEVLHGLPAQPGKFVIVPHVDERPAGTRVLQIGVVQICAIHGAVVIECGWNVEVGDLLAVLVAHDVAQPAVVHPLRAVFRIPDEFVDEVAQVQNETEPIGRGSFAVLEDHALVGVLGALIGVLTTYKREFHRARVVFRWSGESAANSTASSVGVGEPVPVLVSRLKSTNEAAAR